MNEPSEVEVTVVYGGVDPLYTQRVRLPQGSTVGDWLARFKSQAPWCDWPWHGLAVFGEWVDERTELHDGDRLEWLMPLKMDPKEARRNRAKSNSRQR